MKEPELTAELLVEPGRCDTSALAKLFGPPSTPDTSAARFAGRHVLPTDVSRRDPLLQLDAEGRRRIVGMSDGRDHHQVLRFEVEPFDEIGARVAVIERAQRGGDGYTVTRPGRNKPALSLIHGCALLRLNASR